MKRGDVVSVFPPAWLVLSASLTLGLGCRAEDRPPAAPAPEPFAGARSLILKTLDDTGAASIAVAVAKGDEIVWEGAYGWADRQEGLAATPETVYPLASISKAMTATGLMVLVERGLVDLDRPVNEYLEPSKLTARAGNAQDATVRHLVFHTAGLPTHWNIFTAADPYRPPPMDESIARYGFLVTPPGETYRYSNFGYGILGHVISRAAGEDYADYMRDAVFRPLGLARTSVGVAPESTPDVAAMYDAKKNVLGPYVYDHDGASAVVSSVHDLVRFGMFHGGHRLRGQEPILSPAMMTRLHEEVGSSFHDTGGTTVDYLLGSFASLEAGRYRLRMASGGMPGAASRLVIVPSAGVVTALIANGSVDLWPIAKAILGALLPDFTGETAGDQRKANDDRSPFLGTWSGEITTYAGPIAAGMTFRERGGAELSMRGKPVSRVPFERRLGDMGFADGVYRGLFLGRIDTPDAARSPHVVLVELRRRGERLVGTASAVARNESFCLPYFMELSLTE